MRIAILILAVWVVGLGLYLLYDEYWHGGKGTVVVISDPPGAEVWLDLEPSGQSTNGSISNLKRGKHSVTVKKDGFRPDPFVHVVDIRPGNVITLKFSLVEADSDYHETGVGQSRNVPPPRSSIEEQVKSEMPWNVPRTAPQSMPDLTATTTTHSPIDTTALIARADTVKSVRSDTVISTSTIIPAPKQQVPAQPEETIATVEVSSSVPGADIFINNQKNIKQTPAMVSLPAGIYTIRVQKDTYTVTPEDQVVRVSRAAATQFVFFTLVETAKDIREFTVFTEPVEGEIYVDGALKGKGRAVVPHDFGLFEITFGEVEGYETPEPIRLTVNPSKPNPEVRATYSRAFRVAAWCTDESTVKTEGDVKYEVGVYEKNRGAKVSNSHGSTVEKISGTEKFGWELAMGDANRNPTGGDYIEFIFTLPDDVPPATPLSLKLYLYRSNRRYPLSLSNRNEITVTVNGRVFLDNYRPRNGVELADSERSEEWSLQHTLVVGENRIMIRTSDQNAIYCYLWKN